MRQTQVMDLRAVNCGRVQAALSARHDGEEPGLPDETLEAHLSGCASCREFATVLDDPDGSLRAVRREPVSVARRAAGGHRPDLAAQITSLAAREDRAGVWWVLRLLLALVALGYLAMAVPELVFAADPHHAHLARHLGAFETAYAVGLLFVAARPAKARAMVPFTVALAAVMGVAMVVDLAGGHAFPLGETTHLLELAGLVLVWLLATRRGWPGGQALRQYVESRAGRPPVPASRPALVPVPDEGPSRPSGRQAL